MNKSGIHNAKNISPVWNRKSHIILESDRDGNKPTYNCLQEKPKTVFDYSVVGLHLWNELPVLSWIHWKGFKHYDARKNGVAPVFQDPALIPDISIQRNLVLTGTDEKRFKSELSFDEIVVVISTNVSRSTEIFHISFETRSTADISLK